MRRVHQLPTQRLQIEIPPPEHRNRRAGDLAGQPRWIRIEEFDVDVTTLGEHTAKCTVHGGVATDVFVDEQCPQGRVPSGFCLVVIAQPRCSHYAHPLTAHLYNLERSAPCSTKAALSWLASSKQPSFSESRGAGLG